MKTCLFGGTFDPPHFGHLIVAQTIFEAEHFDKIVFIPAHIPPHKKGKKISSLELRLEMLKIAIKDNPNFEISDIEIKRGGYPTPWKLFVTIKIKQNCHGMNCFI